MNGLGIDNHMRQTSATTGVSYFLTDHVGSTSALSDASANLVEQVEYDSFGNSAGSTRTRYTYTGRERDSVTGSMYYRARFYDPQLGRFISEDPIGFGGGELNLFVYVKNSPLNHVDPKGTNPLLVGGIVAVVIGGEALLHHYLGQRAYGLYPDDPFGRKKHCYVNCMSSRIHLFDPTWPTLASVEQEAGGLVLALVAGDFKNTAKDSAADLAADAYGQQVSLIFWRSCQRLCDDCPF